MDRGKARVEFVVSNDRDQPVTLIIEPWAEEFPMRPKTEASVVCETFDVTIPVFVQVTDDYIILNDIGDDVCVRYDGRERVVGEVDRP